MFLRCRNFVLVGLCACFVCILLLTFLPFIFILFYFYMLKFQVFLNRRERARERLCGGEVGGKKGLVLSLQEDTQCEIDVTLLFCFFAGYTYIAFNIFPASYLSLWGPLPSTIFSFSLLLQSLMPYFVWFLVAFSIPLISVPVHPYSKAACGTM